MKRSKDLLVDFYAAFNKWSKSDYLKISDIDKNLERAVFIAQYLRDNVVFVDLKMQAK